MEVPSIDSAHTHSSDDQHHAQVEVLDVKHVKLDEVDVGDDEDCPEPELVEPENLSDRSSACDCPAHVHDRDTPLLIDKVTTGYHYIIRLILCVLGNVEGIQCISCSRDKTR